MSVDIILKHSSQAGKEPDAGSLKQGELAINTKDVKAYIKNSDGQVVQIAGADNPTTDGRYVKLVGDGTAQEITGTGGLKTEGLLESGGGVKVSGSSSEIDTGLVLDENGNFILKNDSKPVIFIYPDGSVRNQSTARNAFYATGGVDNNDSAKDVVSFAHYRGLNDGQICRDFIGYSASADDKNGTITRDGVGFDASLSIRSLGVRHIGFRSNLNLDTSNSYNFYAGANAPNFFKGSTYIGGSVSRNTFELWKSTLTEEQLEQYEAGTLAVPANVSTPGDGSFARAWYYDQQDAETQALLDSGELEYPEHLAAATFTDTFDLGDNTKINLNSNGDAVFKNKITQQRSNDPQQIGTITQNANGFELAQLSKYNNVKGLNFSAYADQLKDPTDTSVDLDDESLFESNRIGTLLFSPLANDPIAANAYGCYLDIYSQLRNVGDSGDTEVYRKARFENGWIVYGRDSNAELYGYRSEPKAISTSKDRVVGFGAYASTIETPNDYEGNTLTIDQEIGFYSTIRNEDDQENYNFYAGGTAPNYFSGDMLMKRQITGGSYDEVLNAQKRGFIVFSSGEGTYVSSTLDETPVITFRNPGGPTGGYNNQIVGSISTNNAGTKFSCGNLTDGGYFPACDYRLKENVSQITDAVTKIKLLNPVNFNYIGDSRIAPGFIAHEVSEVLDIAVSGEKDATEEIGTLYDFDGTVLETGILEPPVEEQSYVTEDGETRVRSWIETGSRPIYQGVDQTKLIPLLTKALQEALERIEALEAAAAG